MPARSYDPLGGIGGVQTNPPVPYSSRGNDKDRVQTFVFEDNVADPFIGTIHFQGCNGDPTNATDNKVWVDLVSLTFDGIAPVGNVFLETSIEMSQVRVECRAGNYTSGSILNIRSMR